MYIIYMHVNTLNGKAYIGQTNQDVDGRKRTKDWAGYKGSPALYSAVQKYGAEVFRSEILCRVETRKEANRIEQTLIAAYNTTSPNGYNLTSGGYSSVYTEEVRRKISESKIGENNPKGMLGKKHTLETKRKMSKSAKKGKSENSLPNTDKNFLKFIRVRKSHRAPRNTAGI